jgi:hypothetical protein
VCTAETAIHSQNASLRCPSAFPTSVLEVGLGSWLPRLPKMLWTALVGEGTKGTAIVLLSALLPPGLTSVRSNKGSFLPPYHLFPLFLQPIDLFIYISSHPLFFFDFDLVSHANEAVFQPKILIQLCNLSLHCTLSDTARGAACPKHFFSLLFS